MTGMLAKLRALLGGAPPQGAEENGADAARIGELFRGKHTNFRLLLTSGKRLDSTLADMERALTDGRVFGMTFLRAGTTSVAVNAFRMLTHLKALDPAAAQRLSDRYQGLLAGVEEVLGRRTPPACGDLVYDLARVDARQADLVGARLAELGDIKNRLGLPVPEGFVVGACAYEAFASQPGLREEIARRIQAMYDSAGGPRDAGAGAGEDAPPTIYGPDSATLAAMSREIQALVASAPLPQALERAIAEACERLARASGCTRLCVLPNSLGEGQGFTGVYPAQFGVPCADVLGAYRRALAGKYSVQAMRRRLVMGIPDIDVAMCVGVLALPGDVEDWLPEGDEGGLRGAEGECLRGTCRTGSCRESARAAGLGAEDAELLAGLSRRLEEGLGAPALFEWVKEPGAGAGGIQVLRCGPLPPPGEEGDEEEDGQRDPREPRALRSHMEGSPVHQRLGELLGLLSPLTLPAPEDPGFRAANCQTVRDVARVAHQRAVEAMVEFGRGQQDFAESQAKQLWAGGAAMQWWIINLGDAFQSPPEGKFIRLENIASQPFQAVWAGISAFPWAGPPPVDARGFLSIMYESTTNPEIGVLGSFDFGAWNHILLSRAYVSLSSRFGYHFVTIEALVGERNRENYVSFQFRGGAAEVTRRARRIQFVSGILGEFGFAINVREDSLTARVEALSTAEFMDRLKVLGYLIIHTRQLDMIMRIPEQVRLHREKILREIGQMLRAPRPEGLAEELPPDPEGAP